MSNIKYLVEDSTGGKLFSNCSRQDIPDSFLKNEFDGGITEAGGVKYRAFVRFGKNGKLFYISNAEKHILSKSTFLSDSSRYFDLLSKLEESFESQKKLFDSRIRRLFHNISSLNAMNAQELEKIFPPSLFEGKFTDYLIQAKEQVAKKPDEVAISLFKIYKDTDAIKHESVVFKALDNDLTTTIQPQSHSIHKVLLNVLYKFYSDFTALNIYVNVEDRSCQVLLDYRTFSAVLFYMLDNAVKYCMPGTRLEIKFREKDGGLSVDFEMWSTPIEEDEIEEVRKEGVRGREAVKKCPDEGDGIGLYCMTKLAELNKFQIVIEPGTLHKKQNNINYTDNIFSFFFPEESVVSIC